MTWQSSRVSRPETPKGLRPHSETWDKVLSLHKSEKLNGDYHMEPGLSKGYTFSERGRIKTHTHTQFQAYVLYLGSEAKVSPRNRNQGSALMWSGIQQRNLPKSGPRQVISLRHSAEANKDPLRSDIPLNKPHIRMTKTLKRHSQIYHKQESPEITKKDNTPNNFW